MAIKLPDEGVNLNQIVREIKHNYVFAALDKTLWQKTKAAKLLGLNRTTLLQLMIRLGLPLNPKTRKKEDGSLNERNQKIEDRL